MRFLTPILASSSDDTVFKVIGGVIVFIIWGIGALAKMAKGETSKASKSREAMERAMMEQMEISAQRRPPGQPVPPPLPQALQSRQRPGAPAMANRVAQQRPPQQKRVQQKPIQQKPGQQKAGQQKSGQQKPGQRRRGAAVVQTLPAMPAMKQAAIESDVGNIMKPAVAMRRDVVTVQAETLRLALTPRSLRQQFMLTEILQPPVSLRD